MCRFIPETSRDSVLDTSGSWETMGQMTLTSDLSGSSGLPGSSGTVGTLADHVDSWVV